MTKPLLSHAEKLVIADKYKSGQYTQEQLATAHFCSRRTIQRALQEQGLVKYKTKEARVVTEEEEAILREAKRYGLKPGSLQKLMNQPALSKSNVQVFLTRMPGEELVSLINAVSMARKFIIDRNRQAANSQVESPGQVASNG